MREIDLPFPPFPGLGIRLDVYDMVDVDSVIVGDPRFDVTCIVHYADAPAEEISDEKCEQLGFESGPYP